MEKEKNPKQLDLFEKPKKEWQKHGFATREQWNKAKEYDRAFRHMEQANMERLARKYGKAKKPNLFRAFRKAIRGFFDET